MCSMMIEAVEIACANGEGVFRAPEIWLAYYIRVEA